VKRNYEKVLTSSKLTILWRRMPSVHLLLGAKQRLCALTADTCDRPNHEFFSALIASVVLYQSHSVGDCWDERVNVHARCMAGMERLQVVVE